MKKKKQSGITLFVKTTKLNYLKNVLISCFLSINLIYFIVRNMQFNFKLGLLLIYFVLIYRITEFFLTSKTIFSGHILFGRIMEGKEARNDAIVYFILLIGLIILIILWG